MKRMLSMILLLLLLWSLALPVGAEAQLDHVTDAADLLTEKQWQRLEKSCIEISETYNCGVYILTLDDYTYYGSGDVFDVAGSIYHEYELGEGAARNGLLLLLSIEERDFALFVYGEDAEYAFDSYGQEQLEAEFKPYLQDNDWYGACNAYVNTCADYLKQAANGDPVRAGSGGLILICVAVSFVISLIVVSILNRGMKNVRKQTKAASYVAGKLNLTDQRDQFTHRTETRRKIESNSGSSSSRSGSGGSGRSGKF